MPPVTAARGAIVRPETVERDIPTPPIPAIPSELGHAMLGANSLSAATQSSLRFEVEWQPGGAARLAPVTPGAASFAADAAIARRLERVADALALTAQDGPNRVGRVTFAPTIDAWGAARTIPRVEYALASVPDAAAASSIAQKALKGSILLRGLHVMAEYIPGADEIVFGPAATRGLFDLGPSNEAGVLSPTIATHVVRHELAHAALPVANESLRERTTNVLEEARAELLARWDARMPELGARLGLSFNAAELAASSFYPREQAVLIDRLRAVGIAPGSPRAIELLRTTPGDQLAHVLGVA